MKLHCADDLGNFRNDAPVPVKNREIGIDDMTPKVWKTMTDNQRKRWWLWWFRQGHSAFECEDCGFPVAFGGAPCEVCEPGLFKSRRNWT